MLYDITPAVDEHLAVWPGDPRPSREIRCHLKDGAPVTVSVLHTQVHCGAHADAPNHYGLDAPGIDERSLEYYLGPCQVIEVQVTPGGRIAIGDVKDEIRQPRILFKTGSYPDQRRFNEDYVAVEPTLVDWLHERGVILVGMDTPSVDTFTSKDLPAHHAFLRHDMAILEVLDLREVPVGEYELIALPLKLVGYDASPVRAVLRPLT
ncbi:MAG: cyclase family protein [Phycisphaerales bacterium]|nr:cyclase family protein [Phycisphaerales bacterium]